MSSFELAIPIILEHEGGFVNDKDDPGGATNRGITLRTLLSMAKTDKKIMQYFDHDKNMILNELDIKNISLEQTKYFYHQYWWKPNNFELIKDQSIANKAFDISINIDYLNAIKSIKMLQDACNAMIHENLYLCDFDHLVMDGKIGYKTLSVINHFTTPPFGKKLFDRYCNNIFEYYESLVKSKPTFKKYIKGWKARAYKNV